MLSLYYEHDLTEPEPHLPIDGLLISLPVPCKQRCLQIDKPGMLSIVQLNRSMNHTHCMSADLPRNPDNFI